MKLFSNYFQFGKKVLSSSPKSLWVARKRVFESFKRFQRFQFYEEIFSPPNKISCWRGSEFEKFSNYLELFRIISVLRQKFVVWEGFVVCKVWFGESIIYFSSVDKVSKYFKGGGVDFVCAAKVNLAGEIFSVLQQSSRADKVYCEKFEEVFNFFHQKFFQKFDERNIQIHWQSFRADKISKFKVRLRKNLVESKSFCKLQISIFSCRRNFVTEKFLATRRSFDNLSFEFLTNVCPAQTRSFKNVCLRERLFFE